MTTQSIFTESRSYCCEEEILVDRLWIAGFNLLGNPLPRHIEREAERLAINDLIELVMEVECMNPSGVNANELLRYIEVRIAEMNGNDGT